MDFGCGPGPLLAQMLEEAGFRMHKYDPYFHPERATLAREYDFVTCTEVAEHFMPPRKNSRFCAHWFAPEVGSH
ncbi:methyltransferase domain-containing protein [Plesiomonas shigelloides subsp. oncorhynchi]|nr:methyltransferase domain-containing protein [Plesiomonas shigelloides]